MSMTKTKPEWVQGEYGCGYDDIVKGWGYEVLHLDEHGAYQGDYTALLRDGDRYGFTTFGYGSCSGCDELQAISPWGDDPNDDWGPVIELAERMHGEVKWFDSGEALAAWLIEKVATEGKGTDWYWYDGEVKTAAVRYAAELTPSDDPQVAAEPSEPARADLSPSTERD